MACATCFGNTSRENTASDALTASALSIVSWMLARASSSAPCSTTASESPPCKSNICIARQAAATTAKLAWRRSAFRRRRSTPGEAAAARAVSSFCSASQHRRTTRSEPSSASSSRVIAAASCSAFAVSTRASAASSSAEDAAIPLCAAERVPEALVKRSATRQKSAQTNWTEILRCLHPFELETSTNVTAERTATHGQPASVSLSGVVSFFKGLKLGGGAKQKSRQILL